MNKTLTTIIVTVIGIYLFDVTFREMLVSARAKREAKKSGKPMLNVGAGVPGSSVTGSKLRGDVNCDLAASKDVPCGPRTVCHCDAQDLSQFKDKQFGVALIVNVLKYVPDKEKAMRELERVADKVIVSDNVLPWFQWGPGPKFPVKS